MSAVIIQFPDRGRAGAAVRREETKPTAKRPAGSPVSRAVKTIIGGAWYHEQAIEDAERNRKN
jgi:hypothetical protein